LKGGLAGLHVNVGDHGDVEPGHDLGLGHHGVLKTPLPKAGLNDGGVGYLSD
jgi:hypothetical protein